MEKVGFYEIETDDMGNILGFIGMGPRLIAYDAHIDTVGPRRAYELVRSLRRL